MLRRMILLLLALPLLAASSDSFLRVPLIENWECGPENDKWAFFLAKIVSQGLVRGCHDAVKADANLCCKAHDHCYDVHSETHFNQFYCDKRFCNCLQDVTDRGKDRKCKTELDSYCSAVKAFGWVIFPGAAPNNHWKLSADFQDAKPWGLDTKSLVGACQHSKKIAVHCHNSAVNCLMKPHERDRRDYVEHSHQDCRSTMYDCLQTLTESTIFEKESETCILAARSLAEQMHVYAKLDEERHGKAIIDTYPIVASRLLKHCSAAKDSLEKCYRSFDACAQKNHRDHSEMYNAARRIELVCHQGLGICVHTAVESASLVGSIGNDNCTEAWSLANSLFRDYKLEDEKGFFKAGYDTVKENVFETFEETVDKAKTGLESAANAVGGAAKTGADMAWSGIKSAKDAVVESKYAPWNWIG